MVTMPVYMKGDKMNKNIVIQKANLLYTYFKGDVST